VTLAVIQTAITSCADIALGIATEYQCECNDDDGQFQRDPDSRRMRIREISDPLSGHDSTNADKSATRQKLSIKMRDEIMTYQEQDPPFL